ncbi:hypothetical protein PROFUN_15582, partial [Planoprotostelium fungivorum]
MLSQLSLSRDLDHTQVLGPYCAVFLDFVSSVHRPYRPYPADHCRPSMAESHLNKFKRLIDANYPAGERYADQKGAARKEDFNALLDELATKTTERFSVAARGPLIQALTTD